MESVKVNLINENRTSLEEVIESLVEQKSGTDWAEKTNKYAVAYVQKLGEVYGDVWYKGLLTKELFFQILLPKHGHSDEEKDEMVFFPIDTPAKDAILHIRSSEKETAKDCLKLVEYLKEDIRKNGFKTSIVLVVINGQLKHVDGLHRMIALHILLEEGHTYNPIPVFLCDGTK